jgi:hypothetical protein
LTVSHTADLQLMRASRLHESDPAAAARNAREILAGRPGTRSEPVRAAHLPRLGQSRDTVAALDSMAPEHRDTPPMQLELGRMPSAATR